MKFFDCPRCGAAEAISVTLTPIEYDVNAGGDPEIMHIDCGCEPLTAAEADAVEAEALKIDPMDWAPDY